MHKSALLLSDTRAGCMRVWDKYRSALPSAPRWQLQLWEVRMLMCLQCLCAYAWLGAPFINKSWVISYLSLFTYKHFLLIHCTISRGAHCPTWICIIHSALYLGVLWSQRQTVRELRVRHLHLSTKHRGGIQEDKTFYEQSVVIFFFFF